MKRSEVIVGETYLSRIKKGEKLKKVIVVRTGITAMHGRAGFVVVFRGKELGKVITARGLRPLTSVPKVPLALDGDRKVRVIRIKFDTKHWSESLFAKFGAYAWTAVYADSKRSACKKRHWNTPAKAEAWVRGCMGVEYRGVRGMYIRYRYKKRYNV